MKNKKRLNDMIKTETGDVVPDSFVAFFRTWLEVADVMSKDVATISPDETVVSAAKIMSEKDISCIIVVDNGSVTGILTETDLLKKAVVERRDFGRTSVAEVMSSPVESASPDLSVLDASKIMSEKHIKRLPILDDKKLVGVVTQTDLVRVLTSYGMWRDVSEIMTSNAGAVQRNATVAEAAGVMTSQGISCIAVLDGDEVAGVLTERDLLERVVAKQSDPARVKTEEIMSSPVMSVPPTYSVFTASKIMEETHIRRLAVIEDKQLCGIVTQTDIFKAVKKKLQEEEEKNFKLLENSGNGIYIIDLEDNTTYVNPAFVKLFEASGPEEFVNQPFLPERFWFNPKERADFVGELEKRSVKIRELALKTTKGRKIYVTLFSALTRDLQRQVSGSQGILYDVTAKKELVALRETEEALRESEEKMRSVLETAPDTILNVDHDGKILFVNRTEPGITPEETVGTNVCDHIPPEHHDTVKNAIEQVFQTGQPGSFELVIHSEEDGNTSWQASRIGPVKCGGQVVSATIISRDVTEHRHAEEALKEAKARADLLARQAQGASEAKGEFLANMSHEIRTPMNAIIGFSEVLAEENLADEQRSHVDIIRESAENLLLLINDILDFSKIEAGRLNIDIVDCSLGQILAGIESLMRPEAKKKGLTFEVVQCDALPAQIRTDAARLRQCLVNLTSNAIKFTGKGHVYVNVSRQEVNDKPYIRFDVEDTGIGIPADRQKLIFEEFAQADSGSTRRYEGTGLGLSITKSLAHLLGGELTLTSEVGRGSVFSLTIPTDDDVKSQPLSDNLLNHLNQAPQSSSEIVDDKFSGNVLVAEDSRSNQMLIKLLLERMGFTVTVAEDGNEVVDKALSQPFDLIFMDIQMPDMNGYEATKMLREKGITTPIIAVSAYAMKGDNEKCIAAGCDDYLAKPIGYNRLLETVRKYLSRRQNAVGEAIALANSQPEEPS